MFATEFKVSVCFYAVLLATFVIMGCGADNSIPDECQGNENIQIVVKIEQISNDDTRVVTENNAEGDGLLGAIGGGALAIATGGLSVPAAAIGGGLSGAYAGSGNTEETTTTTCRFRVTAWNQILVYHGDTDDSFGAADAYHKCKMLHQGDEVTVIRQRQCFEPLLGLRNNEWLGEAFYKWRSGAVSGKLN